MIEVLQCHQIWQNFAILANSSKSWAFFDDLLTIWEILDQLWQISNVIGQVLIDENNPMLKNKLAIWSH